MIKDDQGGTRNPCKCMNVMKQDAMDDKIKQRCKTCEKQCMQEDLDRSRSCRVAIKQKPTLTDRESMDQTESFLMDQEYVGKLLRQILKNFDGSRLH